MYLTEKFLNPNEIIIEQQMSGKLDSRIFPTFLTSFLFQDLHLQPINTCTLHIPHILRCTTVEKYEANMKYVIVNEILKIKHVKLWQTN